MKNKVSKTTATNKTGRTNAAKSTKVATTTTATKIAVKGKAPGVVFEYMTNDLCAALSAFKTWMQNEDYFLMLNACDDALIYGYRAGVICSKDKEYVNCGGTWTIEGKKRIIDMKDVFQQTFDFLDQVEFAGAVIVKDNTSGHLWELVFDGWEIISGYGDFIKKVFSVPMLWKGVSEKKEIDVCDVLEFADALKQAETLCSAFKVAADTRDWEKAKATIATINKMLPAAKLNNAYWSECKISINGGAPAVYTVIFYNIFCDKHIYVKRDGKQDYLLISEITFIEAVTPAK